MQKRIVRMSNTCFCCGKEIKSGDVCSDCNRGPDFQ